MHAWTKAITRPTKTNIVFASLIFIALFIVAWSRTDFSTPTTTPTATPNEDNALYAPLDVKLGPNLTELTPIEPEFSTSNDNPSTNKTIPSSVKVEARKQPTWQPVIVPTVQKVVDILSPVVSAPTNITITVPDVVDTNDTPECSSLLSLEVCV